MGYYLPRKLSSSIQSVAPEQQCNYIITKKKSKTILAQYLHVTVFSPLFSNLEWTIDNGNFISWPGIDELNFKKLLGTKIALEKGHPGQERKGV